MEISPGKLRPRKVTAALRRRIFEWRLRSVPLTPYEPMEHLGTDYGGWWVPADRLPADRLCYCVGVGSDVSFEVELLARGMRVRSFDPFPVFGEMAKVAVGDHPRFQFSAVAIAAEDGPVKMYGRQDSDMGSVSAVNLYDVQTVFTRPGRAIPSLMSEFGDPQVPLLKLDVEGSEYDLLPTLDLRALGVQVLCLEVHHNRTATEARRLIASIAAQGLVPVRRKDPTSFTFMRL